ncbi:MAG: helix-hairpin-helix domain-containing protein [Bacteroidales bacterium]|nr:helix-hairpin-helix domain-containing protein [Bacteroidales bacterium]
MIKKRFKEYFTFTKKERNGLFVLLIILFVLILVKIYQSNKSYGEVVLFDSDFQKDIKKFEESLIPKTTTEKKNQISSVNQDDFKKDKWFVPEILFDFDPNQVSKKELKELGFSDKQAKTLMNYREKGGLFFTKNDLLKIYGIGKEQFGILEPYIIFEVKNKAEDYIPKISKKELIEINSASKEDLMKITGIGSSYADRIIKYKNLLGGYYEKNQILEVYGMDSIRYLGLVQEVLIDTNLINKLNLNEADFITLLRHPYLNKYQTEAILKYKNIVGDFTEFEQIHENNLLTKREFVKIKPYLKLN